MAPREAVHIAFSSSVWPRVIGMTLNPLLSIPPGRPILATRLSDPQKSGCQTTSHHIPLVGAKNSRCENGNQVICQAQEHDKTGNSGQDRWIKIVDSPVEGRNRLVVIVPG